MPTRLDELEKQLTQANERLKAAMAALAPEHQSGEWNEYLTANNEALRLEREVAKAKNEPYCIPFDFPVKWNAGAPLPFLLCNDYTAFLTFCVSEPDPNWDGKYVTLADPASPDDVLLCLVTFKGYTSAKLGHPNDEALEGHWLHGKGQEAYTAQLVINSPWLDEIAETNSCHPHDNPSLWKHLNHYVFWFHDSTFECLSESYKVEVLKESMASLLNRVQARLLEQ